MTANPNAIRLDGGVSPPLQMCIEATRWCNLKCEHCRRTVWGLNGNETIAPGVLEALSEVFPLIDQIAISGWGESLYGPNAWELMRRVRAAGTSLSVTTNATLMGESMARRLIEMEAGFVSVSLDAGTPEGYRRLRPGAPELEKVAANVRGLVRMRESWGIPYPLVGANFVLHEESAGEMEPLVRLLARAGVHQLCVQPRFRLDFPAEGLDKKLSSRAVEAYDSAMATAVELGVHVHRLLPEITDIHLGRFDGAARRLYFLPTRQIICERNLAASCKTAWESPFVDMNGGLYPCNFYPHPLGNIHAEGSFDAAWDNERFRAFRRGLQRGEPSEFCRRCHYNLWYQREADKPLKTSLRLNEAYMEGLGFYEVEQNDNEPPFRWTRAVCEFYLANGPGRWLGIEAFSMCRKTVIDVTINGKPCGKMAFGPERSIQSVRTPETDAQVLRVTLRCRNPLRDPAAQSSWERRRLLGVAMRRAALYEIRPSDHVHSLITSLRQFLAGKQGE